MGLVGETREKPVMSAAPSREWMRSSRPRSQSLPVLRPRLLCFPWDDPWRPRSTRLLRKTSSRLDAGPCLFISSTPRARRRRPPAMASGTEKAVAGGVRDPRERVPL